VTKTINLTLKVWRQTGPNKKGRFETYNAHNISTDMSFLEMLDVVNEQLTLDNKEPIAFDMTAGKVYAACAAVWSTEGPTVRKRDHPVSAAHAPFRRRRHIAIEPFRAMAFKVIKDLAVDRSPLDKIIQAGGYISVNTGGARTPTAIPVGQDVAELSMDAAQCIGCGACVAACPNASAMLFTGAKVSQLALLPQGKPEAAKRAINMLRTMDRLGFGNCTNERECEPIAPRRSTSPTLHGSIVNSSKPDRRWRPCLFFCIRNFLL
jgi:succinate dehydrogenase / fumarate reductase iron-sulfur subunit